MTPMEELKRMFEEETQRNKDWQEKHDRDASIFRKEIMDEIKPYKEFAQGLSFTWKILLAISAFIMSVIKAWAWIKEHVK